MHLSTNQSIKDLEEVTLWKPHIALGYVGCNVLAVVLNLDGSTTPVAVSDFILFKYKCKPIYIVAGVVDIISTTHSSPSGSNAGLL